MQRISRRETGVKKSLSTDMLSPPAPSSTLRREDAPRGTCISNHYIRSSTSSERTSNRPSWWCGQSKSFSGPQGGLGMRHHRAENAGREEGREGRKGGGSGGGVTQWGAAAVSSCGWWVREERAAGGPEKMFLCFLPTPPLKSQTSKGMWWEGGKKKYRDYFPCLSYIFFLHLPLFQNPGEQVSPVLTNHLFWVQRQEVQGGKEHINRGWPQEMPMFTTSKMPTLSLHHELIDQQRLSVHCLYETTLHRLPSPRPPTLIKEVNLWSVAELWEPGEAHGPDSTNRNLFLGVWTRLPTQSLMAIGNHRGL